MFRIENIQSTIENVIELIDSKNGTKARINLSYGASIDELVFNNIKVITNLKPLDHKKTYPSSILFPFANRIKEGKYAYEGQNYNLDCNEKEANNALHGLVYDKTFTVEEKKQFDDEVEIKLFYEELNPPIGYPFKFRIELLYKLTKDTLILKTNIINIDQKKFPFTLGWHPYFNSIDLDMSEIEFSSTKKIKSNKNNISVGVEPFESEMPLSLSKKLFDDAFILEQPEVKFFTPEYDLVLTSSEKENFLQLYTPINTNAIAIEPMTGISDSFNNKIGLKELLPDECYGIEWQIFIKIK